MTKKNRQAIIGEIIEKENVCTQEELLSLLLSKGIDVTQATVSRDIKEMRIIKQPLIGGEYKYSLQSVSGDEKTLKYKAIFTESVMYCDRAMNICLVKCHSGTAQAACAAIDAMELSDVVGTLAGDDTIFVLCRDENGAVRTKNALEIMLK